MSVKKGGRRAAEKGFSAGASQKKEKVSNKYPMRANKRHSQKKQSKHFGAASHQPDADGFEGPKFSIGVIKESHADEERGTVELKKEEYDDTYSKRKYLAKKLNSETLESRVSRQDPKVLSDLDPKMKIQGNHVPEINLKKRRSNVANESLPYISQNRSSVSSMTCIQPQMQQIIGKTTGDDANPEAQLTQTFAKHFQSNKKIMERVSMSHQGKISNHLNDNTYSKNSNTMNTQSFLSQQSRNSYSKSNREKAQIHNSVMIVDPINVSNDNAEKP